MKFSTRATYGIRALIRIGANQSGLTSISQIAKAEELSPDYLERLVSRLKRVGIVRALKGSAGGYELAKPATDITLLEVLQALEGFKSSFSCAALSSETKSCNHGCHCPSDNILGFIQSKLNQTLTEISLADLIKKQK